MFRHVVEIILSSIQWTPDIFLADMSAEEWSFTFVLSIRLHGPMLARGGSAISVLCLKYPATYQVK
jgi:hypothetical protein